jgi:hypothetical protein
MKKNQIDKPLVHKDTPSDENILKEYHSRIGRLGGKAGTGAAKRRSKLHYREAALERWRRQKALKKQEDTL